MRFPNDPVTPDLGAPQFSLSDKEPRVLAGVAQHRSGLCYRKSLVILGSPYHILTGIFHSKSYAGLDGFSFIAPFGHVGGRVRRILVRILWITWELSHTQTGGIRSAGRE